MRLVKLNQKEKKLRGIIIGKQDKKHSVDGRISKKTVSIIRQGSWRNIDERTRKSTKIQCMIGSKWVNASVSDMMTWKWKMYYNFRRRLRNYRGGSFENDDGNSYTKVWRTITIVKMSFLHQSKVSLLSIISSRNLRLI